MGYHHRNSFKIVIQNCFSIFMPPADRRIMDSLNADFRIIREDGNRFQNNLMTAPRSDKFSSTDASRGSFLQVVLLLKS